MSLKHHPIHDVSKSKDMTLTWNNQFLGISSCSKMLWSPEWNVYRKLNLHLHLKIG